MTSTSVRQWRVVAGFLQGMAFYLLYKGLDRGLWPLTDGMVFVPAALVAWIVPVLVIVNLGNMRGKTIAGWALIAAALLVALGGYDVMRHGGVDFNDFPLGNHHGVTPSLPLLFFVVAGFFIGQCLVMAADNENRRIASYPRYFDIAWKLGIQLALSGGFVIAFWLVLWMGTALFMLIKISFFEDLIQHDWFFIPATTMSFAYAVHVTDMRVNLVRGIRTLKLATLSWLLPIMALFVAGFIGSLPFKGVELLWKTHHTSQILLGAAAWLILLINATYQDGLAEHIPGKIMKYSGTLGAVLLLPLILIADYALFMRVHEYGWSVHIIEVFFCLLVTLCYAVGYMAAVLTPGQWLRRLENTNIYTSYVIIGSLLALFSPLADPARLSVDNQVHRLLSGKVSADKFDFFYLKEQGEVYGLAALRHLKNTAKGPDAALIVKEFNEALASANRWQTEHEAPKPEEYVANITVYPQGQKLPDSFTKQDWADAFKADRWMLPQCLFDVKVKCDAYIIPPQNGYPREIALMNSPYYGNAALFRDEKNKWTLGGMLPLMNCKGVAEAMKAGNFKLAPASGQELIVNGMHLQVKPEDKCP